MNAILLLVALPLMLLNVLGGIVGLIWMMWLGQWGEIVWGLLAPISALIAMTILLWFGIPMTLAINWLERHRHRVATVLLGVVSSTYHQSIVLVWIGLAFYHYARMSSSETAIPFLLWGYSIAMAPLAYMAKGDSSVGTNVSLLMGQIAFVGLAVCFFVNAAPATYLIVLAAILAIAVAFTIVVATVTVMANSEDAERLAE